MPKPNPKLPTRDSLRSGINSLRSLMSSDHGPSELTTNGTGEERLPHLENWNRQSQPGSDPDFHHESGHVNGQAGGPDVMGELETLRRENADLRSSVQDLQELLEEARNQADPTWPERQKEYESLLEEKSEVIRTLHLKLKEAQEAQARMPIKELPKESELRAMFDDLEREQANHEQATKEIKEMRAQLEEDEQDLMDQMKSMELAMAKERAEMARQRNELQRLHAEIRHEIESASRDAGLRERLMHFQRRHQEVTNRRGSGPVPGPAPGSAPAQPQAKPPAAQQPTKKSSGFFRRLFGG